MPQQAPQHVQPAPDLAAQAELNLAPHAAVAEAVAATAAVAALAGLVVAHHHMQPAPGLGGLAESSVEHQPPRPMQVDLDDDSAWICTVCPGASLTKVDLDDSAWICTVCETDSTRALLAAHTGTSSTSTAFSTFTICTTGSASGRDRKLSPQPRFGEAYLDCSGGLRFRGGIRA